MCVFYPCKQFVVVTIRRTGSWNTIPTLGTHLYRTLAKSTGIHYRFIVWFLERTIILEDKKRQSPSEQISSLAENSLESITIQSDPHSASTVAALLNDIFTLVVVIVVVIVITPRSRAKPNRIYRSSRKKFTFFLRSTLAFLAPTPNQYKRKKGRRRKTNNNNLNIKTMTHHRMGFTPSTSSTTKPSAITTKKSPQRACLGGMVITPCEKCTIRTYVSSLSLSLSHPIPFNIIFSPYPIPLLPSPPYLIPISIRP